MLVKQKFSRKPFYVEAVRVTTENMEEVAQWVEGEVRTEVSTPERELKYVNVRVHRPLNERQSKAYVGDWVLQAGGGFKVYTDKAFKNAFEEEKNVEDTAQV